MKAQFALSLFLSCILLAACQKEVDYAKPTPVLPEMEVLASHASDIVRPGDLTRDYCIELITTNWLVGFGTYEPLRQTARERFSSRIPSGLYVIQATGDGMSAEYARSTSELKLTYNSRTNYVSGAMITKFFNGEVLEQEFEGGALAISDLSSVILKVNVRSAKFHNGSEALDLIEGEIIFALPLKPVDWFETNVYTKGMFCTSSVN